MLGVPAGGARRISGFLRAVSLYRVKQHWYIDIPNPLGEPPRIRRSAGTTDKKQAQAYHDRVKEQLWRQARLGEKPPVTWGEAVKKWIEEKERGMPDRYRLRALNIPIETPLPLSTSLGGLQQMAAGSFNRTLALIVAIHNCSGVTPPQIKRKPNPQGRTRFLSEEEWQRLSQALTKHSPLLRQCAEFTLQTGLRENNVLNLEWSQVDLNRKTAWIYGDQAKAGHPIAVPLNDAACAILASRRGIDKTFVFGNPDYALYKASNRAWYAAVKEAKLKGFRWHDLRHTWASWHVMNGTRIEELAVLGGWKTLSMVQRYAHLATDHLAKVASNVKPVSMRYNAPRRARSDRKTS